MKNFLASIVSLYVLLQLTETQTTIEDFKVGTKFQLSKAYDADQPRPWVMKPNNPSQGIAPQKLKFKSNEELKKIKCVYEEKCSSPDDMKIQVDGKGGFEPREDIHFIYYTTSVVAICKERQGQPPGWYMSADFSGCLMAQWTKGGERYVGHVDTSKTEAADRCKLLVQTNYGTFFKPYDGGNKNEVKEYESLNKKHEKATMKEVGEEKYKNLPLAYKVLYKWGLVSNVNEFYLLYVKRSLSDESTSSTKGDPITWTFEVVKMVQRTAKPLKDVPLVRGEYTKDDGSKKKKPFYEEGKETFDFEDDENELDQ
uniref:Uncharacterized protein n=1 Tax=Clytia hemisphaerica TaxID=252671 RepID=A0A7M5X8X1_9CNID